jgi:hypothetical protein
LHQEIAGTSGYRNHCNQIKADRKIIDGDAIWWNAIVCDRGVGAVARVGGEVEKTSVGRSEVLGVNERLGIVDGQGVGEIGGRIGYSKAICL